VDKKYERAELLASMEHLFMNKGIAEFAEIASKQFKNSVAVPTMVRSKVPKLVMITADGEKKDVRFFFPKLCAMYARQKKPNALVVRHARAGTDCAMDLGAARRVRKGNAAGALNFFCLRYKNTYNMGGDDLSNIICGPRAPRD